MGRSANEASQTVTRKPDDAVGSSGKPATGGGGHTAEQSAITDMGSGGRTDADRNEAWDEHGGEPGRAPPALGGSSAGQSDRKASRGPKAGETVAAGHYKVEREDER